jgi:16S rRNA processing protein RimM
MGNYRNIGKIVSAHGLAGELILKHRLGVKTSLKGLEFIFLEGNKDEMLPYLIETVKTKDREEIHLKLEGIHSKEMARKLVQKQVWLREGDFQKYAGKSAPINWVGYRLINEGIDLGEILEIIEQPHQVLCRIEMLGKEVLIPVHEQTLQKIDNKERKLFLELPDGLLDIYLDR